MLRAVRVRAGRSLITRSIALTSLAGVVGCRIGPCANKTIVERLAPDSSTSAVLFTRSCSAVTKLKVGLSLIPPNSSLPNEAGNVFFADDTMPYSGRGRLGEVSFRWSDSVQLIVRYPRELRVRHQVLVFDGLKVIYEPF